MPVKRCIVLFLTGFKDSLHGCVKFFQRQKLIAAQAAAIAAANENRPTSKLSKSNNTKTNEKLYQRLFESCVLNGVFLLSCMLAFNFVLIPILNWIYFKILSSDKHDFIRNYFNPFLELVFSSVWILPVFLLSKIFNLLWHQEIADIAFQQKYEKAMKKLVTNKLPISEMIADTIFSCSMEFIFLIQSSLMSFVPISFLSQLLVHIHLSFLYSLYAFEYKWFNMSWKIEERINHIETTWPYYFGFGLSLSIILSFANSYIYSATIFAFIFPAFILSAIESNSENFSPIVYTKIDPSSRNNLRQVVLKLPLFRLSLRVTDFLFKVFRKKEPAKIIKQTAN